MKIDTKNFLIKIHNNIYFNTLNNKIYKKENGIIFKNINDFLENIKFFDIFQHINITIIPTFRCTLECSHCFIKQNLVKYNEKENINLNRNNIIKYIHSYNQSYKIKSINVVFVGGEPLINYELCNNILDELIIFCKKNNIKLKSSVSTSLFININHDIINFLKKNNSIMISVDGNENSHNNQRKSNDSYINKNPFKKTIENLNEIIKYISIKNISINCSLSNNFLKNKNIIDDVNYIMNFLKIKQYKIHSICPVNKKDKEYFNNKKLFIKGFNEKKFNNKSHYRWCCGFRYMSNFIISPNGNISTNYHDINNSIIGNLNSTINELEINYKKYILNNMPVLKDESCMNCPALNYCWGKCFIYSKYLYKNNPSKYCDRKKIINLLKKSIKNKYIQLKIK
mgnify:CR=1 FL=1